MYFTEHSISEFFSFWDPCYITMVVFWAFAHYRVFGLFRLHQTVHPENRSRRFLQMSERANTLQSANTQRQPHCSLPCTLKANSHIPCHYHAAPMPFPCHAAPMPFPCHAAPLRVWILSFPFDLHSAAVFDSHMPCRTHAVPVPCHDHTVLKATSQGYGTARHGHGMAYMN
jgi:hypothetical protein